MNKKILLPIIIVVILVVLIGVYFATLGIKGPEEKSTGEETTVSSEEPTEKEMAKSWEENFNLVKEVSPVDDLSRQINSDFKAVLGKMFGGVKLEASYKEASYKAEGAYGLTYRVKRELRDNDVEALMVGFREKGYTEVARNVEGTSFHLALEKESLRLTISKDGEQITVWGGLEK